MPLPLGGFNLEEKQFFLKIASDSSTSDYYVVQETATLNWTTNGFTNQHISHIGSGEFCPPNSANKFELWLGFKNVKDNISSALFYFENERELPLRYCVSIMNKNGNKQYTRKYRWHFSETSAHQDNRMNVHTFIDCNSVSKYLIKGNLILYCEVDVLEKDNNQVELQNDYQALLENSEFSDVVLLVMGKEFKAHKNILAARSKVFRAMFSADLEEKKQNRVEITDVEVDVFEHLLRYIYTGKIQEIDEHTLELFVTADKYQLDHLKSTCLQSLGSTLKVESVVQVLVIADMHNASELKSKCLNFINANSSAVIATDDWKQMKSRPNLLMQLYEKKSDVHDTKKQRTK